MKSLWKTNKQISLTGSRILEGRLGRKNIFSLDYGANLGYKDQRIGFLPEWKS